MRVTEEEIEAAKTEKGGWSRKTIEGWGIPWPPPHGWRRRLTDGVTEENADYRADMPMVELHGLFRKVVSAIVANGHAGDLYDFPEVLEYFGAQKGERS